MPLIGFYCTTKWTVEALHESMTQEVKSFCIKATLLEPSAYAIDFGSNALVKIIASGLVPYAELRERIHQRFASHDRRSNAVQADMNDGEKPMTEVAIQGAGIAGSALALLLARQGYSVTVFERARFLRSGGQAVDVRGAALKVMEELKLIEEVRACRTHFRGMSVCDEHDNELERTTERTLSGGRFDSDDIELFRDDLSQILFSASSELVTYVFGDEVVSARQQSDCVDVELRNGGERSFDLLVGADGLHSGVRRLAFGRDEECVHPAGIYAGIYSTSNSIGLDAWQLVFRTPERGIIVYPDRSNDELRVALYFTDGGSEPPLQDTVAQKCALKAPFGDVGGRFRTLVAELDGADDLYASEMAQVRMRRWSDGRIVLAGDAAYCPSPLTGQGTSLALVGAYVLAEEIGRSTGDLAAAAESHERRLRPFVEANLAIDLRTGKGIDDAKNAITI